MSSVDVGQQEDADEEDREAGEEDARRSRLRSRARPRSRPARRRDLLRALLTFPPTPVSEPRQLVRVLQLRDGLRQVLQEVPDAADERHEQQERRAPTTATRGAEHRDVAARPRDSSSSPSRTAPGTRRRAPRKIPRNTTRNMSPIAANAAMIADRGDDDQHRSDRQEDLDPLRRVVHLVGAPRRARGGAPGAWRPSSRPSSPPAASAARQLLLRPA